MESSPSSALIEIWLFIYYALLMSRRTWIPHLHSMRRTVLFLIFCVLFNPSEIYKLGTHEMEEPNGPPRRSISARGREIG